MNIKEKAKQFAINAHAGQVRKSEPDKPMIIHPIGVALLLEEYGYDDNVVAAGYLHDVVEDTRYTIEDIKREFGNDIASLVMCASEPDKSLSWEERKKHTIETVRKLPLRNKLVVCADKINNLEDIRLKFEKNGVRDFSKFNRGEESQRWYYTSIYDSLVANEDENLPLFQRLKEVIDIVFRNKEDLYLKDTIFLDNQDYYNKLKKIHAQKLELQKLKSLCSLPKPFIIEFSGTPRTGKTTIINNLYDFFKKGGFNISVIEEFTTSKYYKEKLKDKYKEMNRGERNLVIVKEVYKQLKKALESEKEIILIDRSINDRQIWNYIRYDKGDISEIQYLKARNKYVKVSRELIDFLVLTYTDPLTSLRRDYNCNLALENRTFLNLDNITEYNNGLKELEQLFSKSVEDFILLDTTSTQMSDVSIEVASKTMSIMRRKYIEAFNRSIQN